MRSKKWLVLLLFSFQFFGCKKDETHEIDDKIQISFELDGKLISKIYPQNEWNGHNGYSFGMPDGEYYGFGGDYELGNNLFASFTIGSAVSHKYGLSNEAFKNLFSVGAKQYDSLDFNYGSLVTETNKVQMAYMEANGKRWSTTQIRHVTTAQGLQIVKNIHQQGSTFFIDQVKEVTIPGAMSALKIKGHFNCILYEEDGTGTKLLKNGFFLALIVKRI